MSKYDSEIDALLGIAETTDDEDIDKTINELLGIDVEKITKKKYGEPSLTYSEPQQAPKQKIGASLVFPMNDEKKALETLTQSAEQRFNKDKPESFYTKDTAMPQYNENFQPGLPLPPEKEPKKEFDNRLDNLNKITDKKSNVFFHPDDIRFSMKNALPTEQETTFPEEKISLTDRPNESFTDVAKQNLETFKKNSEALNSRFNQGIDSVRNWVAESRAIEKEIREELNKKGLKYQANALTSGITDSLLRMEQGKFEPKTFGEKIAYGVGNLAETGAEIGILASKVPLFGALYIHNLINTATSSTDLNSKLKKATVGNLPEQTQKLIDDYKNKTLSFKELKNVAKTTDIGDVAGAGITALTWKVLSSLVPMSWTKAKGKVKLSPEAVQKHIDNAMVSKGEKNILLDMFPNARNEGIELTTKEYRQWIQPFRKIFTRGEAGTVKAFGKDQNSITDIIINYPEYSARLTGKGLQAPYSKGAIQPEQVQPARFGGETKVALDPSMYAKPDIISGGTQAGVQEKPEFFDRTLTGADPTAKQLPRYTDQKPIMQRGGTELAGLGVIEQPESPIKKLLLGPAQQERMIIVESGKLKTELEEALKAQDYTKARKVNKELEGLADEYDKLINKKTEEVKPVIEPIKEDVIPKKPVIDEKVKGLEKKGPEILEESRLIEEAKKYDSAEEFVDSKQMFYHATDSEFDVFDLNKSKAFGASKFGHWFTEKNVGIEGVYGKNVKEASVSLDNPKVISKEKWDSIRMEHAKDGEWFKSWKEKLINDGYDGIKVNGEMVKIGRFEVEDPTVIAVFTDNQVKTKQQLTEIWNKSQKQKEVSDGKEKEGRNDRGKMAGMEKEKLEVREIRIEKKEQDKLGRKPQGLDKSERRADVAKGLEYFNPGIQSKQFEKILSLEESIQPEVMQIFEGLQKVIDLSIANVPKDKLNTVSIKLDKEKPFTDNYVGYSGKVMTITWLDKTGETKTFKLSVPFKKTVIAELTTPTRGDLIATQRKAGFNELQINSIVDQLAEARTKLIDEKGEGGTYPLSIVKKDNVVDRTNLIGDGSITIIVPNTTTEYTVPNSLHNIDKFIRAFGVKARTKSGELYAKTDTSKIGNFENIPGSNTEASKLKIFEEVKDMVSHFAGTLTEGKLNKRYLGMFYTKTKAVKINGLNNLSTAIHEITHAIDDKHKISNKVRIPIRQNILGSPIYDPKTYPERKQLSDIYLAYYGGARADHDVRLKTIEGLAVLIQKYVEMPETIKNSYPLLYKEFIQKGGKYWNSDIQELIDRSKSIVSDFQSLPALDKVGAFIADDKVKSNKKSFLNLADVIRTEVSNMVYPIEKLSKMAEIDMTEKDPSVWMYQYNNFYSLALNNILSPNGYFGYTDSGFKKLNESNWYDLVKTLIDKKSTDTFGYYLASRRGHFDYLELDDRKRLMDIAEKLYKDSEKELKEMIEKELDITKKRKEVNSNRIDFLNKLMFYDELKKVLDRDPFTRDILDNAWKENKDRFLEEEKLFDTLIRYDLDMMSHPDVQLITPEQKKEYLSREGYASYQRERFDEITQEASIDSLLIAGERIGRRVGGGTKVSTTKARTGSERTIISPLHSGIMVHAESVKKSLKQIIYNKMLNLAEEIPELFAIDELTRSVDQNGRVSYPQERDPDIVMARKEYKRIPIRMDRIVKRTMDDVLTVNNIGIFGKLIKGASRLFTKGTTGLYPQFALSNAVVDQFTATANTTKNFMPIIGPLKALFSLLQDKYLHVKSQDSQYFMEFLQLGGDKYTLMNWLDKGPDELFQAITKERAGILKVIDYLGNIEDIVGIPSRYSEIANRAVEYINSRKSGESQIVALERAGRITGSFHHFGRWGGEVGRTWTKGIPYFNPGIQILDQMAGRLNTPEGRKRYAVVATLITAGIIGGWYAIQQSGTDAQKEMYRDISPEDLARYLYLPNTNGKDLIRIRMPENLTMFGNLVNMALENSKGNNYSIPEFFNAGTAFLPDQFSLWETEKTILSWIPHLIKVPTTGLLNKKTYPKVKDIENIYMRRNPKFKRYTDYTSLVAKKLGETQNVLNIPEEMQLSPIMIDYYLENTFGRTTRFLTLKPGATNLPFKVHDNFYTGRSMEQYYTIANEVTNAKARLEDDKNAYNAKEKDIIKRNINIIKKIKDDMKKMGKLEPNDFRITNLRERIRDNIKRLKKI